MASERQAAIDEFRYSAHRFVRNPSTGTRYALEMAAVECQLRGVDPSTIEPEKGASDGT